MELTAYEQNKNKLEDNKIGLLTVSIFIDLAGKRINFYVIKTG